MKTRKYIMSYHLNYHTGHPSSIGGTHSKYDTYEQAEKAVQEQVEEDVYILENNLKRKAVVGDDYYDSKVCDTDDFADCYRHTDIGNSECFYYIDEIEI